MRKFYIIGNPDTREKVNSTFRVIGMSIVLGYACIGFGVFLRMVVTILSW